MDDGGRTVVCDSPEVGQGCGKESSVQKDVRGFGERTGETRDEKVVTGGVDYGDGPIRGVPHWAPRESVHRTGVTWTRDLSNGLR